MNLNEVAAARARELYRERSGAKRPPRPHRGRESRPVHKRYFPHGRHRRCLRVSSRAEGIVQLQEALVAKELEYDGLLIAGRTELQDALPIRLGQVFGAWAGCVERDRWRFRKVKERLRTVALGGTAIGTCFAASPAYVYAAERELSAQRACR